MNIDTIKRWKEATDQNFSDLVLKSDCPVLVDFWAPWCNPCLVMAPVMDKLASVYEGKILVVKCNVDQSPEMSTFFGIQSIPTLILFDRGSPIRKIIGLIPAERIQKSVEQALSAPAPINSHLMV